MEKLTGKNIKTTRGPATIVVGDDKASKQQVTKGILSQAKNKTDVKPLGINYVEKEPPPHSKNYYNK